MWSEIKVALNSTLNSGNITALDKIVSDAASDVYYGIMSATFGGDSDCILIPYGTHTISGSSYRGQADKKVIIPSTVRVIGTDVFALCASINNIIIPEGVTEIQEGAFYNCSSLKNVILPMSLRTLGNTAFFGTALTVIKFKSKVTIGSLALPSSLTDIYVPWSEGEVTGAPWGASGATIHYNTK